ncbi:MAG: tripartite tricarboxylate transporter substrate binding protein [Clostridiales bacterium]|nr:tripartite tricarboxylate transporter substrate binding protein [Clostridiales bacterium]
MKKITAILLSLVMLLSLCACGSGAAQPAPTAQEPAASDSAAAPEAGISEAAQKYPSEKVITWYTQAAGSASDVIARIIGPKLGEILGQNVVYENLGGAGGMNMLMPVYNNPADGYSIASLTVPALCMTPFSPDCPYTYEDFSPLYCVQKQPQCLTVRADAPYTTIEEFIQYIQDHPDTVRLGSPGASSVHYMALAGWQLETGLPFSVVAYDDAPTLNAALLGGHIEGLALGYSEIAQYVNSGDFRILCFTTHHEQKPAGYEDIPTFAELGYSAMGVAFQGICIKAGTDPDVYNILTDAFEQVFADPEIIAQLTEANIWIEGTFEGPEAFTQTIINDYNYYEKVLNETGLMQELYG